MPVPHPEVDRDLDALGVESGLQPVDLPARDRGQRRHAAEELVVPGNSLRPLRRDAPAPEHVGQKRPDIGGALWSAEGDHKDGVERPAGHPTTLQIGGESRRLGTEKSF